MKQENEDGAQADYSLRAFFRTVLRSGNTYDFMIVKCLGLQFGLFFEKCEIRPMFFKAEWA